MRERRQRTESESLNRRDVKNKISRRISSIKLIGNGTKKISLFLFLSSKSERVCDFCMIYISPIVIPTTHHSFFVGRQFLTRYFACFVVGDTILSFCCYEIDMYDPHNKEQFLLFAKRDFTILKYLPSNFGFRLIYVSRGIGWMRRFNFSSV